MTYATTFDLKLSDGCQMLITEITYSRNFVFICVLLVILKWNIHAQSRIVLSGMTSVNIYFND